MITLFWRKLTSVLLALAELDDPVFHFRQGDVQARQLVMLMSGDLFLTNGLALFFPLHKGCNGLQGVGGTLPRAASPFTRSLRSAG